MENNQELENQPQQTPKKKPAYIPRPLWRVIAAWIGLVLFVAVVIAFNIMLMKGGL